MFGNSRGFVGMLGRGLRMLQDAGGMFGDVEAKRALGDVDLPSLAAVPSCGRWVTSRGLGSPPATAFCCPALPGRPEPRSEPE